MNTETQAASPTNPAAAASGPAASPVPFKFADGVPEASFILGADLTSTDETTANDTAAALQAAYTDAIKGVPVSNILNDWPKDEDGNLLVSADYDYHIIARATGTFAADGDRPARNVVQLIATPSVAALSADKRGVDFIQDAIVTALVRRAAAVMGSFYRSGDYTLPATLIEWIAGRETSGGSSNAARGNLRLFNLVRADIAKIVREGLGAKMVSADLRGLLASKAAMSDKFNLADKPEAEAKIADKLFEITRKHMLARAVADVKAWRAAPAVDPETGTAKPEDAPWPVNSETGEPDAGSLVMFFRPLADWERDRAEAVPETVELDLSGLDDLA